MSICTAIEKVDGSVNGDLLKVTIDNITTAYWFFDYTESMKYLNQEVIVEYRQDILNGQMQQFIKTFTIPTVVQTLDKQDNFKLFVDTEDNQSNLSFNEIESGETKYNNIVFCVHQEFKSSPNATWLEMIIRDKLMHVAKLRLFNYDTTNVNFEGKYIITDLSKNQYGFQTNCVNVVSEEGTVNPEIAIAEQYVTNFFAGDAQAMEYITKMNLLSMFKEHIDYEKGYGIVRLAMELAMCDAMRNITNDVDVTTISHVLLCSYGYLTRPASVLSSVVNNVFLAQQVMFPNRKDVVMCLDECLDERPNEAVVVKNIRNTVDVLLKTRKGVI